MFDDSGFTRRIVGVPKAESDSILKFLFEQIAHNVDFQVRFKWNPNDIAFWDNRVCINFPSSFISPHSSIASLYISLNIPSSFPPLTYFRS